MNFYKVRQDFTVVYKKTYIEFLIIPVYISNEENVALQTIDLYRYQFVLSNYYPFYPPKLFIQSSFTNSEIEMNKLNTLQKRKTILYIETLKTSSLRILKYLDHYYGGCLCCKTILCQKNWSPTYHIEKILQEIELFNQIKRTIKYHILLDHILWQFFYRTNPFHIENICIDIKMGLSVTIKMHILNYLDITDYHLSDTNKAFCNFYMMNKMKSLGLIYIG